MPVPVPSPVLPEWLRENSLVSRLLSESPSKSGFDNRKLTKKLFSSQKRALFLRETELFVAHGKDIRCADLKDLKSASEKGGQIDGDGYQTLELPELDFDISQLVRSADGETAIIVGEYDVGVALLPATGVMTLDERTSIILKWFKLEPGTTEAPSRIAKAIFHPLGAQPCVIVLTEDAMIHVYEVEFNFDSAKIEPTETHDLKQMLGINRNSSYLIDDIEPSSMCFGGVGSIWSIFTLYILMKNGEIYSICPFLPSKWMLDSDFLDELNYELTAHRTVRDSGDPAISDLEKYNSRQICFWIHEISRLIRVQNLTLKRNEFDEEPAGYLLSRPTMADVTHPLLQGPYLLQPAPEDNFDELNFASDIARIGSSHFSVIAVAWTSGKIDLMLEFDSVAPRWHSTTLKYKKFNEKSPYPVISGYETIQIDVREATEGSSAVYPSLTTDINFPGTLLFNHGYGVEMLNLDDWMKSLTDVVDQEEDENVIGNALMKAEPTGVVHVLGSQRNAPRYPVLGSAMVYDAYLGYLVIGATTSKPAFAVFQLPSKYNYQMAKLKQERSDLSSTSSKLTPRPPVSAISHTTNDEAIASTEQKIQQCRERLLLAKKVIDPRLLKSEIFVNRDHMVLLQKLKDMLFDEMDARYENAQQIYAAALQQQKRFHEQINNIRRFQNQLLEREKQQQGVRDKFKQATETQQVLKDRVERILSKLSAISKKEGYSLVSQAEQEYVEEIHGIEKIIDNMNAKQQKMADFMSLLKRTPSLLEAQPAKPKPERQEPEVPDSNREALTKMVQKEHRLVEDIRKKVGRLENQLQELGLDT
ncbi:hypothetical protein TWF730_007794 [Orbilia blumenaviensis]|uniref:Uncharacterized protein n=1 Tax=Orbilia blumenaviensis TaxID=1796055 RepID=A0AAV9V904_9PEZI